ncbi:MAG: hypothetical protein IH608_11535 [Proteobacteria bacterium]|nr:hypothetical protein [Pseudomonadota bacterium]
MRVELGRQGRDTGRAAPGRRHGAGGEALPGRGVPPPFRAPGPGELPTEARFPFHLTDRAFVLVGRAAVAAVRVSGEAGRSELLVQLPARLRLGRVHCLEGNFLASAALVNASLP